MSRTVTAYFDSRSDAQNAVDRLVAAGVANADVEIHGTSSSSSSTSGTLGRQEDDRSFFEKLGDFFMPDDDRDTYAEGVRRGGSVVTVRSQAVPFDRVSDILEEAGAIDLDGRASQWRSEGWSGTGDRLGSGRTADQSSTLGRVSDAAFGRSSDAGSAGIGAASGSQRAGSTPYSGAGSPSSSGLGSASTGSSYAGTGSAYAGAGSSTGESLSDKASSAANAALGSAERAVDRLGFGRRETDHGRSRIRSYVPLENSEDPSMLRGSDQGLGRRTDVEVEDQRDREAMTPEERVRRGY